MRFLSGRGFTLTHQFLNDETVLVPPAVAVSVYPDGSDIATFTGPATVTGDDWSIAVPMQPVGLFRVVWDGGTVAIDTEYVEVTGAQLFTVREARESDSEIAIASEYPAGEIAHYREVVESEFETITGRSFTPRMRLVSVETDGSDALWLGLFDVQSCEAITGPDGALDESLYPVDENGVVSGLSALPAGTRLVFSVLYGFRFPPLDVKRAGLIRLRYLLASESSGIPDRATSYVAAEGGTFTLATAGRGSSKTGIPEVDAVLAMYSRTVLRDVLAVG